MTQNLKTTAYLQSGLPKKDQTRNDTEIFLVCPVETRNQMRMLLEIPTTRWL